MIRSVHLLFLCLLLPFTWQSFGQPPKSFHAQNSGHIYGKIIDPISFRSISGATVQLIIISTDTAKNSTRDKVIATQISDRKGEFSFENLSTVGDFSLRISAKGYKSYIKETGFDKSSGVSGSDNSGSDKDVGNIKLTIDEQQLQTVTVNSARDLVMLNLDKKVYNVEKDLSATGGTAIDALKNIPSVNVDIDGNVTLRHAPPQIFVDGRPTTLALDQIPADQIASIEIMTNPSARYDASGGGSGILNIVLKKNRKSGYNGNLRANIDSRARTGFGGDINLKQNKINFFASGNLAFRKSITTVFTDRTDFLSNGVSHYTQNNKPVNKNIFGFGRVGFDYLIDNRNTLTFSENFVSGKFKVKDYFNIYTDTITTATTYKQYANRTLDVEANFKNFGSTLGFKHNFARSGRDLTADVNLNYSKSDNISDYNNSLFDQYFNPLPDPGAQRATGGGSYRNYTFQTDYTDPFSKTQKIEMGLRSGFRNNSSWNDNYLQQPPSILYTVIPNIGVRYKYNDRVLAAYASYTQKINNFSYQAGLRAENSRYEGDFISKGQIFKNSYPLSFFPSMFLSYKLDEQQNIQLNYSRKINRPNFFQLIPFVDFSDSLNLSVGNPALKPEFTHLVEFAYSNQYNAANSVLASLYAKITTDLITRYQYIDSFINPSKPGRYISYANASRSATIGLEITGKNKLSRWWDITSNVNFFKVKLEAGNIITKGDMSQFSWFGKVNNSFKLPKNYSIQLSGEYQAKTILPPSSARTGSVMSSTYGGGIQTTAQGYLKPTYGADIAIRKEFFKNNTGSLTLQFTDIFRTRVYAIHADAADFSQDNRRYRDPQLLRLNFNWRFGKLDSMLFKRKNNRTDSDSLQGIQGG